MASTKSLYGGKVAIAGFLLGFSLGGFFDGILLHQILQWHHLLSGLEGAVFRDLRFQVLADGFFHLLMYVIALAGFWLLWRGRAALAEAGITQRMLAWALVGFGLWHMLDGVLSHWLLGLHRIRMDSDIPLFWDLLWFFAFGVLVALAGIWLLRRPPGGGTARRSRAAGGSLAALVVAAGALSALPPRGGDNLVVVFAPGVAREDAMAAVITAGTRPIWSDPAGGVWALSPGAETKRAHLYRQGALFVSGAPGVVGCLAWLRR